MYMYNTCTYMYKYWTEIQLTFHVGIMGVSVGAAAM